MPLHAIFTLWCTCIARAAINCVRNTPTRTGGNAKKADEHTTGRDKYINRKYLTWAIDYGYIGGMLYILDTVMSEVKFNARNILIYQAGTSILVCMLDILKVIFFSKLVTKAKTGNIIMLRKRVAQTLSIEAVMLACFTQININMMYWAPLRDSVMVIGVDKWYEFHISQLLVVYLEYLVISFIKDKIVMQIFIGPLFFCSIMVLFGGSSFSIHYASFFLSVVLDQTVHSLDPPLSSVDIDSDDGDSDDDENDNESKTKPQPPSIPPQQPPQSRKTSMLKRSSDYVIILPSILEGNQENFD